VRTGELPADLDDLFGALALSQHDFGKPDAPQAVEIERVVRAAHFARIISAKDKRQTF
jgi:hypothetical protein